MEDTQNQHEPRGLKFQKPEIWLAEDDGDERNSTIFNT